MDTFNDFFARSSLKILGSQFYPPKQLTNVLNGLPPLHLIFRTMIVKFILKSLTQRYSSSAKILQIEETPNHEFFPQVYDTKMFLLWKLKYLNEKTGKPFAEIDKSDLIYIDKLIKLYQCGMWDNILKNDMNGLINSDPFCIEPLHSTEELSTIVHTKNLVENPLIARHNSRYQGTNLLDFLHGRCLRFQNFVFSVLKFDKSKFVPLCLEYSSSVLFFIIKYSNASLTVLMKKSWI